MLYLEHLHLLIADSNGRQLSCFVVLQLYITIATVTETESYQKELKELEELLPDLDSKVSQKETGFPVPQIVRHYVYSIQLLTPLVDESSMIWGTLAYRKLHIVFS